MSKSVVTEIQSHITIVMPVKSAVDYKAVEQILQAAGPQLRTTILRPRCLTACLSAEKPHVIARRF
jgi:hypothetical protein